MEETTRRVMDDCMDEEHDAVLVDVDRGTSCASSVRSFSFGDAEDDEMTRIPDGNSMEDAGEVLPTTNDSLVSGEMTDDDAREIARTLLEAYDAATSRDELDRMVDAMKVHPIAAGEVVVANVDDLECLYIIQDGEIQLVVDRADSSGLMLRPGDHFGSFVDVELPSNVVVVATKTSVLWVLENVDFQLICFDSTSSLAGAQIERMTHLRLVEAFVTLSDDQIADLAVSLEPAVYQDGDCIIRQGDIGDYFYVIQEGQVICKSTCSSLARHRGSEEVARISSGDYFGEIALLNGMPRTASVYADGIVKCLRLSRDAFTTLLGPLIEVFEQRHLLRTFMAIPEFAGLTVDQLQFVLAELEVEMYYEGECIFTEGDEADALFIIKSGFVCLMSDHEDLASASAKPHGLALTANDPFGFESLGAMNRRYASTAIASADVQVLILRRSIHRNALHAQIENLQLSDDVSADRSLLDALLAQNKAGEIRPVHDETAPPIWDVSERYQSTPLDLFENVQLHRLKKGPSISKGVMADIRLTNVEGSDDLFILKEMSKAKLVSDGLQIHPLREKSALMEIRPHPMIVKLYKTFQDRHHLYALLEYVPGGELFQFCINTPQLSDETVRFCAANAILGLQHIHSEGFIYRNMRPENLLLGVDGYIKFVDFAFAKRLPFTTKGIGGEEETHTRTYTICGTPDYLAPEIIMGKGHDHMVDYWTLGVMIYELLVGCAPFAVMDSNTVERYGRVLAVGSGRNPVTFPTNAAVSTEARDLINQLLRGPSNRLGSGDRGAMVVREHAWFSSVDWERMLSKDLPAPTRPRNSSRKIRLPDEYFGLSNTEDETGHFAGF